MSWNEFIDTEMKKNYFITLSKFLKQEHKSYQIYPPKYDIFNAFYMCDVKKVRVVILGQDCYHSVGQAHGLAFSVPKGIAVPPSLRNIFKELKDDLNIEPPNHGCLESWASQGVLLLNSILTVRAGLPGSHRDRGWEIFTDEVIKTLNDFDRPIVFILWGSYAKSKKLLITNKQHLVLESTHPSPFSANNGFFGCKHFSKANEFLKLNGIDPIDWTIK